MAHTRTLRRRTTSSTSRSANLEWGQCSAISATHVHCGGNAASSMASSLPVCCYGTKINGQTFSQILIWSPLLFHPLFLFFPEMKKTYCVTCFCCLPCKNLYLFVPFSDLSLFLFHCCLFRLVRCAYIFPCVCLWTCASRRRASQLSIGRRPWQGFARKFVNLLAIENTHFKNEWD